MPQRSARPSAQELWWSEPLSPDEIERQRQLAIAQKWTGLLGLSQGASRKPGNGPSKPSASRANRPANQSEDIPPPPPNPGFSWAANLQSSPLDTLRLMDGTMAPEPAPPKPMLSYGRGGLTAPPRPDPRKENVFQRGPDGQLHPIPGWRTTGPFDFDVWSKNIDWNGAGKDLSEIGIAAYSLLGGRPDSALGQAEKLALRRRVGDNVQGHHSDPRFLGGRNEQDLVDMVAEFHRKFHRQLSTKFRQAGRPPGAKKDFPPVGGTAGSRQKWQEYFDEYPGSQYWARELLRGESRDFDIEHGTSISPWLERELNLSNPKPPSLPKPDP